MGKIILIIFLFATSCRTVRNIEVLKEVYDSTAIRERDSLIRLYRSDSAGWTSLIESLSENTIIFQDTGSTRIEYRPDGSIAVVEGRLRSVNAKLSNEQRQTAYWSAKYDSLARHGSKDSIHVKTEYITVEKKTKVSVLPWWIWLLVIPGLLAGYYLKKRLT